MFVIKNISFFPKKSINITRTSKAAVQFIPATGDSYTLTITTKAGATQTSTGQITVSGTTFTLKHTSTEGTFIVTVSANSPSGGTMVSITGDIPIDNSTTKVPAPATLTPPPNQTPIASDYDITGLGSFIWDIGDREVNITPKTGKSGGARTIYYEGAAYEKSSYPPSSVGTYTVTFDVAATTGWNAATNLSAGTLAITKRTLKAGDFSVKNLNQTVDDIKGVDINFCITQDDREGSWGFSFSSDYTPFTIYYVGTGSTTYAKSTTLPKAAGTYAVTFDVAAGDNWYAATGLSAGTLTIDTWSNVTMFSQVDGSWKAYHLYSSTLEGMTFSSTTDNYIITFNANLKTMSVSGSTTTTISGGNINEFWPRIKENLQNQLQNQRVSTVNFNDTNHSYTLTYNNFIQALSDSDLSKVGLLINQDGSELKMSMPQQGAEFIYAKQSSTSPIVPDVSLTGTTWKAEYDDIAEAGGSSTGETYEIRGTYTIILKFTSASAWTMDQKLKKETSEENNISVNGTYMVSGNIVILRGGEMPASGLAGMINGNTLFLSGLPFNKQ